MFLFYLKLDCLEGSLKPNESATISCQTINFSSPYSNPRICERLLQVMPCLKHSGSQKFALLGVCTCFVQQATSSLEARATLTASFANKEFFLVMITNDRWIGSLVPGKQRLLRTQLALQKQGILTNGPGGGRWPCHQHAFL